jgi:hypothetical protein
MTLGSPALIQYTITAFTSTPTSVLTISPTEMTLDPNGNNVTRPSPTSFDLVVSGLAPVNLQFSVVDSNGATNAVVGIALDPESGSGPVWDAFPSALVNDNGLTLRDSDPSNSSYDFVLLVQNPAGGLGLIDPKITNQ